MRIYYIFNNPKTGIHIHNKKLCCLSLYIYRTAKIINQGLHALHYYLILKFVFSNHYTCNLLCTFTFKHYLELSKLGILSRFN